MKVSFFGRLRSSSLIWSYATTAIRFGGLFLVLPIVLRTVPEQQLGLFYLFQSFGAIAALLDAGVGPTVMRSASFAWAGAQKLEQHGHELMQPGIVRAPNWLLLRSILTTFSRFYLGGAGVLFLVLGFGCLPLVWRVTSGLSDPAEGRWIWMFCVIGSAWNFASSIWPSMLGGMNRVRDQQVGQLLSIVAGYLTTVGGLMVGWQLWALALSGFVQALVLRAYAKRACLAVAGAHFRGVREQIDKTLFATVWPASWRTGLLGAAVTAYLSLPVFLTTTFLGLGEAAQVGLAVQLAMTVCQVAAVPVLVKAPQFSMMKVRGERDQLLAIFSERMLAYLLLFLLGSSAVFFLGDWILHGVIGSKTPLPSTSTLMIILLWGGVEGFQAIFRGVALSANDTCVWRPLIIGALATTAVSVVAIQWGAPFWLAVMVLVKWFALDLPVIGAGLRSLEVGPAALLVTACRVPGRVVAQLKSFLQSA